MEQEQWEKLTPEQKKRELWIPIQISYKWYSYPRACMISPRRWACSRQSDIEVLAY